MAARGRPWLLIALATACGPSPAASGGPASVEPVGPVWPSPEPVEPPAAPSAAEPPRFEAMRLDPVRDPYQDMALPAGKPLRLPGSYAGGTDRPARWLTRDARGISVIDADSLKLLGTISEADSPDDIAENVALLPGWQGPKGARKAAALRLEDGKVVTLRATLPSGERAEVARLLVSTATDQVLVIGRAANAKLWYGRWDDRTRPDVRLDFETTLTSLNAEYNRGARSWELQAGDGLFATASGACARVRLLPAGPRCVLAGAGDAAQMLVWLDSEWFATDQRVERAGSDERFEAFAGDSAFRALVSVLDSPPRALYARQEGERRSFELLGPKGSFGRWATPFSAKNSYMSPIHPKRYAAVAERGLRETRDSSFVIDQEGARIYETVPLDMGLVIGKGPRKFLAVRRGESGDELMLVDLAAPALSSIASLPVCPGIYWPDLTRDEWHVLSCMLEPDPSRVSYIQSWAVVVDTARKRVYRTPNNVLDARAGKRFVVGTGKRKGAESSHPTGKLELVDLSG